MVATTKHRCFCADRKSCLASIREARRTYNLNARTSAYIHIRDREDKTISANLDCDFALLAFPSSASWQIDRIDWRNDWNKQQALHADG